MRPAPGVPLDRWVNRRLAGFAVRCAVVVIPFMAALATIAVLGQVLPASGRFSGPGRYILIFGTSWLMMALAHHLLHRLLPLAALLEMSLLFPERAPSRLRLARRAASRKDLDDLLAGRIGRPDESTQEAAERILALVSALSEHDRGTRGHSERVRVLTDLIAERLGLTPYDRDRLRWAALLHDVGKLYVPVEVLNKPARPSPREWDLLRRHPHHGERIVAPLLGWLGEWGDVIVQHHEKFNGSGYPSGLAGREICLGARIVSVADAYDVMTAARAYKKPTGRSNALRELVACSGAHFDPDVVRALISVPQRRMLLAMGPISWLTGLPFVGQAPTAVSATLTSQAGVAVSAVAITGTAVLTPIAGVAQVSDLRNSSSVSTVSPTRPAAGTPGSGGKKGPVVSGPGGVSPVTTKDVEGPGPLGGPSGSSATDSSQPPSGATAAEADATAASTTATSTTTTSTTATSTATTSTANRPVTGAPVNPAKTPKPRPTPSLRPTPSSRTKTPHKPPATAPSHPAPPRTAPPLPPHPPTTVSRKPPPVTSSSRQPHATPPSKQSDRSTTSDRSTASDRSTTSDPRGVPGAGRGNEKHPSTSTS